MTIAAGFLCMDGVLVAADTCIVHSDGTKTDGPKVGTTFTPNGTYTVANSAEDGNAANTLAVTILHHLEANNFPTILQVERAISDCMTQWWQDFGQRNPPDVQLILGSVMKRVPRLHFCTPPNTVYQKADYVGIGTGSRTTDPLVKTLFSGYGFTVRDRLWQIAYLFYRAKKDEAFCGGSTTPIFLSLDSKLPTYISTEEMAEAERQGPNFDYFLREMLKARMAAKDNEDLENAIKKLTREMKFFTMQITGLRFGLEE